MRLLLSERHWMYPRIVKTASSDNTGYSTDASPNDEVVAPSQPRGTRCVCWFLLPVKGFVNVMHDNQEVVKDIGMSELVLS